MIEWILHLPTWMMTRVLGIASYIFLFFGVTSGIVYSMYKGKPLFKKKLSLFHTISNWLGLTLGLLHAMILIIDTFLPFTWAELLVPFGAGNEPFFNGSGTLALYGIFIIIFSTDLRNNIGRKIWRSIHLFAYPVFTLALIHGIGVGTDIRLDWIQALYWITAVIVILLTAVKIYSGAYPENSSMTTRKM